MANHTLLDLDSFLPYRLSVLSNRISQTIAKAYGERFGLSITQWRVMAVLGRYPDLSANAVAERTAMDKVAVSRAVNALLAEGRLERDTHGEDRRRSVLRLSEAGYAIYDEVAPLALSYERALLSRLDPEQRQVLSDLLDLLSDSQSMAADVL
ncbi:MAG TPA: MarR family transcriptional regulator [Xanthomonadales bacterium]|nr:MarR family transcriptional regulator [Xanthomonadales bacterium]